MANLYATDYLWDDHPEVIVEVIQEAENGHEAYTRCTEALSRHTLYGYGRWTPLGGRILKPGSRNVGIFLRGSQNGQH